MTRLEGNHVIEAIVAVLDGRPEAAIRVTDRVYLRAEAIVIAVRPEIVAALGALDRSAECVERIASYTGPLASRKAPRAVA